MLNPVRCTRQGARDVRPADHELWKYYSAALDRTYELYRETGRKLIVANFANVLVGIVAPAARRLMCDISPCGGGRCFFAVSASGDLFPCSEFVGTKDFVGSNLFTAPLKRRWNLGVSTRDRTPSRRHRPLQALRRAPFLRLALSSRGARDERRHGSPRRFLRTL